nr:immunoglobulin heavy chain junction region [Mus musculus]MBK4198024.1 immunoglobulin heavy chain junction region [Mus musculus]MBK4198025.1 immunoglobulin heavy chain junction region [Mus musculus]
CARCHYERLDYW